MSEHIPHQEEHSDTRTSEELLHVALTEEDEDVAWEALAKLQRRGDRGTFDHACRLCTEEPPIEIGSGTQSWSYVYPAR